MGMIGCPSEKDFKGMVSTNMIRNCPIDTKDITNARDIKGKDSAADASSGSSGLCCSSTVYY